MATQPRLIAFSGSLASLLNMIVHALGLSSVTASISPSKPPAYYHKDWLFQRTAIQFST